MELRDALSQISEIRRRMADTQLYRGYRAFPTACSGVLALAAAVAQAVWLPDPASNVMTFTWLWVGVAAISFLMAGSEMLLHCRRVPSPWRTQATWLALEQFLPAVLAGALVTGVLAVYTPEVLYLLPGLWQVFFGLGLLASRRLLPAPFLVLAAAYVASGLFCLAWARHEHAFSPLAMGLPFGVGQLLAAWILYWKLERPDGEAE
ncbi:MAG: hypothetical protein OER88_03495 [Planctomycetota bacterium]|nr:hypothetical protein [Planctomycetota bacterium]